MAKSKTQSVITDLAGRFEQLDAAKKTVMEDLRSLSQHGEAQWRARAEQKKQLESSQGTKNSEQYTSLLLLEQDIREAKAFAESLLQSERQS